MSGMKDLLGDRPFTYPNAPGFKERTTSRDAARAMTGRAANLRERVFEAIRAAGARGLTSDEAATALGVSILSVRPRVTEISMEVPIPRIRETGERRLNASGLKAKVWRAT